MNELNGEWMTGGTELTDTDTDTGKFVRSTEPKSSSQTILAPPSLLSAQEQIVVENAR
jgi:hypothetical protein